MKAYLIDARNKDFMDVEYTDLIDMQRFVGGLIECAYQWPTGDTLYVDEEGMIKNPKFFFFLRERTDQPFAGNGLLIGDEDNPSMTLPELKSRVRFGWAK